MKRLKIFILIVLLGLGLFGSVPLGAQESGSKPVAESLELMVDPDDLGMEDSPLEDVQLDDLELDDLSLEDLEMTTDSETPSVEALQPSPWRLTLYHGLSFRVGESKDLVNNRSGLGIEYAEAIAKNYYLKLDWLGSLYLKSDHHAKAIEADYRTEGFLREAWLQRSFEDFSLKLGWQSIVWNEVEGSLATDLINPMDWREFFFVDYEKARIPQFMLSATLYGRNLIWEAFYNPQPGFNKSPEPGSLYYPENPLEGVPVRELEESEPEAGVKVKIKWGKAELSLMTARLVPNQKNLSLDGMELVESAKPFRMMGLGFNYASGTWLWKADLGQKGNQGILDETLTLQRKSVTDAALGFEFTKSQHMITAGAFYNRIQDWQEGLVLPEETGFYSLGWSKSYLDEDLSLNAGYMGVMGKAVRFFSLVADYKFDDELSLQSSLFLIEVADEFSEYAAYDKEDRLALRLSWKI